MRAGSRQGVKLTRMRTGRGHPALPWARKERSMENEIYSCAITPANEAPDGETPTRLFVSKESCGYAVWLQGYDIGTGLLALFHWDRNSAIEFAVNRKHAGENELACQIKLLRQ